MKVVDLFCGAGGFSEGFYRAGFEIVRAYDIWGPAILTHNMNHSNGKPVALRGDIHQIAWADDEEFENAIPDSEIIIGSPPCIAFSNSNKSGKADKEKGVTLIKAFLRIIARKKFKENSKLKYWVMENVGNSEKYVKDYYTMEDLGLEGLTDAVLHVKGDTSKLYNMKYFGVPTNRIRYICGEFPEVKETIKESEVISLGSILSNLGQPSPHNYKKLDEKVTDLVYGIELSRNELSDHHYISEIPEFEWKKAERQKTDKGYMGRMAFPERIEKPARTIMATLSRASRESMIFPLENEVNRYRVPTIREVATLMSFPIDFRFYGDNESVKYRMVGNAVTPKFSYELAKAIRENSKERMLPENIDLTDGFSSLRVFDEKIPFVNLNGNILSIKEEKTKKPDAKYKYHVPYLIEKAFRVELNNFKDNHGAIKWEVSIHRSQGKNAEVFKDVSIPNEIFERNNLNNFSEFIDEIISEIRSSENLQYNFCKTKINRNTDMGPDEMLQKVKDYVGFFNEEPVKIADVNKPVPYKILVAYYILNNITRGLNNAENNTRRKTAN
ncbi:DNA cytosine methyltransferase [Microbacterium sp. APC 3898]|uniref:Cytosine-specific methyltransferase n=1 Tax=Planococcus notacanthi TaxID=3035188 RepID=A0ABT7ZJV7_9BACL|nr:MULTISPECIES: DNA cytosine methyltransferase [Terrabacteria group]MDN3427441.1 DNA cytosine methyltransferase [Planococcus sp. APC 4016]MDN3498993.1 DNA cytosine methyltransferase [Microbacterium sp. APC 3898]